MRSERALLTYTAKVWIIRNQFGRRNITLAARCLLAKQLAEALKPQAKENQKQSKGRGKKGSPKLANLIDSREQAAKEAQVSHGSMSVFAFIEEHADKKTMNALLTDPNLKIHRVAKDIKDRLARDGRKEAAPAWPSAGVWG